MLQLNLNGKIHVFDKPVVMGILNVTPDSFSDGGRYNRLDDALAHCNAMLAEGAGIIDIGGCSTRPNNAIATEEEETRRLLSFLPTLRKTFPEAIFSIDTFRKNVAQRCMDEGADIINDISGGLFDTDMLPFICARQVPYVMMHCVGTPDTMHQYALDGDIHQTIMDFFRQQCEKMEVYGSTQVILDPGIGFGKSLESNYALLHDLDRYRYKDYPILIGVSRKSMIKKLLGADADVENGTTVLNTIALLNGADIIRVHDVKRAVETLRLVHKTLHAVQTGQDLFQ